jgi:hypothetical protein
MQFRTTAGMAVLVAVAIGALAITHSALSQSAAQKPVRVNPAALKAAMAAQQPKAGVDWKSVVTASRRMPGTKALTVATNVDRALVDKTAIPILLPADPALLKTAVLYSFGDQYTLATTIAGAHVAMTGTTAVVPLGGPTRLAVIPDGPEGLTVQRTIDGQLLSYVRYGVLYTVELRCDDPADSRCRSEDLVRSLQAQTNSVLLGKAARRAAGMGG